LQELVLSLLLFSAATLISYHNRFRLSTTFFDFFKSFSQPETFIFAVEFHTTTLLRALSTTFYIYFSKHLHNGGNGAKKEISIS